MPSILTHFYFAEDFLVAHQGDNNFLTKYKDAFRIGSQGPDPLFYIGTLPKRGLDVSLINKRIGSQLHRNSFDRLMSLMCQELGTINLEYERGVFQAFILGQLAHYLLDSTAHPYVYYWSGFSEDGYLHGAYHYSHAHFEGRIDSCLSKVRAREDMVKKPYLALDISDEQLDIISENFSSVLNLYFKLKLKPNAYKKAVLNMKDLYRYIHSGTKARKLMLGRSGLGQLRIPKESSSTCLNNGHMKWKEPSSGKERKDDFNELFNQAKLKFEKAYRLLLSDGFSEASINNLAGDTDYNGVKKGEKNIFQDISKVLSDD